MAENRNASSGGTGGAGKSASGESEAGGSTVTNIASSVRDTASSAMNQAQEAVGRASDSAWQTTREVSSRAGDVAGQSYDYGRRAVGSVGSPGESPIAYMVVGAAIGFGIWYLMNANSASATRKR